MSETTKKIKVIDTEKFNTYLSMVSDLYNIIYCILLKPQKDNIKDIQFLKNILISLFSAIGIICFHSLIIYFYMTGFTNLLLPVEDTIIYFYNKLLTFIPIDSFFIKLSSLNDTINVIYVLLEKLNIANFFNVNNYLADINNVNLTIEVVIGTIVVLIFYTYFFEFINRKGVKIYDADKNEGKWFLSILSIFSLSFILLLIPLIIYLVFQFRIIELLTVLTFYFILRFNIIKIPNSTISILFNYKSLKFLNSPCFQYSGEGVSYRTAFCQLYKNIQQLILFSSFIMFLMGILLNFNLLSMLFIETTLILWYFSITLVKHIPNHSVDIIFNDSSHLSINHAYIVEDFSDDYIVVLTEDLEKKEQLKVYKNSINKILCKVR